MLPSRTLALITAAAAYGCLLAPNPASAGVAREDAVGS